MALTITSQPGNIAFINNPMSFTINTDDLFLFPGFRRPNFVIEVDIILQKVPAGSFDVITTLAAVPDDNGDAIFDISSILKAQFRKIYTTPPLPTIGSTTPYIADNIRNYQIVAREKYGEPPAVTDTVNSIVKIAFCGGISNQLFAEGDYLANIDDTNSLLTWYPDNKNVQPDQPEYISWYNYDVVQKTPSLEVIVTKKDGSTVSSFLLGTAVDPFESLIWPIGWDQLGLSTPTDEVRKYSIQFKDGASPLSPARTYYLDCTFRECKRDLLYLNSFCMPEVFRTTGRWLKQLEVERQQSEKILVPGYQAVNGQRFQWRAEPDNVWIARTGYITALEADALQQMLIGNDLFEILAGKYIPEYIIDNRFDIHECLQLLHFFEFRIKRSLRLRNYDNFIA